MVAIVPVGHRGLIAWSSTGACSATRATRERQLDTTHMTTLTHWVLAHKLIVAIAWLVIMLAGFGLSQTAINSLTQQFELPGREAYVTNLAIERTFGNGGESNAIVGVVKLPRGTTVDSPQVRT